MPVFSTPSAITVPTPATGVTTAAVATRAFLNASFPFAVRRVVMEASGYLTTGDTAGNYVLGRGQRAIAAGANSAYPMASTYFTLGTEASVNGKSPARFLEVTVSTNDVASSGSFVVQLCPVTEGGGAAGGATYSLGTAIATSACTFMTVAVDTTTTTTSSDCFADLADGTPYVVRVTYASEVSLPLNCHMQFDVKLYACHP
jgi:hypothetical protein